MQVHPTPLKAAKLKKACQQLLTKLQPNIKQVARVIGTLVSSFPRIARGPLYHRVLETDKTAALLLQKGDSDKLMSFSLLNQVKLAIGTTSWRINCYWYFQVAMHPSNWENDGEQGITGV